MSLFYWGAFLCHFSVAHALIGSTAVSTRLETLRARASALEEQLADSLRDQGQATQNIHRIRRVLSLHSEERRVAGQRLAEIEHALAELESRRVLLNERIAGHQAESRAAIQQLIQSAAESAHGAESTDAIVLLARRNILERLASRSLREVEAYRVDLADSDRLEDQVQAEKEQLQYLAQDLSEREGVMELSRQLQADLVLRRKAERADQLRSYRELKRTEAQVETLMQGFNSRLELEKSVEAEREISRSAFGRLKGTITLPTPGAIISGYGQARDEKSKLNIFKKGIEIRASAGAQVSAVAAGKVAFSGEVPGIGRAVILDHGGHFYSISGGLGETKRKSGDLVAAGESVGIADLAGRPVYFEIRDRNIPVNPLPWFKQ